MIKKKITILGSCFILLKRWIAHKESDIKLFGLPVTKPELVLLLRKCGTLLYTSFFSCWGSNKQQALLMTSWWQIKRKCTDHLPLSNGSHPQNNFNNLNPPLGLVLFMSKLCRSHHITWILCPNAMLLSADTSWIRWVCPSILLKLLPLLFTSAPHEACTSAGRGNIFLVFDYNRVWRRRSILWWSQETPHCLVISRMTFESSLNHGYLHF